MLPSKQISSQSFANAYCYWWKVIFIRGIIFIKTVSIQWISSKRYFWRTMKVIRETSLSLEFISKIVLSIYWLWDPKIQRIQKHVLRMGCRYIEFILTCSYCGRAITAPNEIDFNQTKNKCIGEWTVVILLLFITAAILHKTEYNGIEEKNSNNSVEGNCDL